MKGTPSSLGPNRVSASALALLAVSASVSVAVSCREPERPAAGDAEGHEVELSDLDRPTADLFAQACEHDRAAFECDECRYEVGVVRAPSELFKDGLLATTIAARHRRAEHLELTGEVRFDEARVTHVSPRVEGTVAKVLVRSGDHVEAGRALVVVESTAVVAAAGDYLETRAALRHARRSFERQQDLHADAITSERELLEARRELEAAEIRASAAAEALRRLGSSASELAALDSGGSRALAAVTVRAPAAGTVLALHAVPGETVSPRDGIATIGDVGAVWIVADLYERDLARATAAGVARGSSAAVAVRAFPGEAFPGRVDFVNPTLDAVTRTVKLRVAVANPEGKLRPGMFATVRLLLPAGDEAVVVPAEAVLEDEGRAFVFVHHHGEYYVRRPVTSGGARDGLVEIRDGLAGGEPVVARGAFLLKSDVLRSKMGAGCAD